jgi:very-short-patch-repair endonuclease
LVEKKKIAQARRLRRDANSPERAAWEVLREFRKQGIPVRRQHPTGGFILDFAVVSRKLAIEIDGGIHRLPAVAANDKAREKALQELGWCILRVSREIALSREHLSALLQRELEV